MQNWTILITETWAILGENKKTGSGRNSDNLSDTGRARA